MSSNVVIGTERRTKLNLDKRSFSRGEVEEEDFQSVEQSCISQAH